MIPVAAIIFDLDGTLVDSRRDLAASVRHLQKYYRARTSTDKEVAEFVGDGVVKLVERALPKLPPAKLAEAVASFKKYYREHCLDHTRPYAGVRATLRHYRRKRLAVVTNKPVRVSGYMLEALGLSPYIDVLIGGDSLPKKKPDPEPITSALKTLGVRDPKRSVVVGDSANDVLAGRAAGARTCGLKSNIGDQQKLAKSKPDFVIASMMDLVCIFS